jgi:hypothetical protein
MNPLKSHITIEGHNNRIYSLFTWKSSHFENLHKYILKIRCRSQIAVPLFDCYDKALFDYPVKHSMLYLHFRHVQYEREEQRNHWETQVIWKYTVYYSSNFNNERGKRMPKDSYLSDTDQFLFQNEIDDRCLDRNCLNSAEGILIIQELNKNWYRRASLKYTILKIKQISTT